MRSNYSRLGDYIREVNVRNRDLAVTELLGVSIQKRFIPSIANTIGTDMSTYKIVTRGQFAYGPVTSRNGDKVSIALLGECDSAIISQAYTVFEVIDKSVLLPEYLMMWFMRPEFDRYARYKSHGSAREIFDWSEMCDVELPIPSPEKQRAIVKEYQTLTNRIKLNETLCAKLEQTAQALYRKMFIDNIDPENLPAGWRMGTLSDIYNFQYGLGNNNPSNDGEYPVYGSNGIIGYYSEYNGDNSPVIGHIGANCGSLHFAFGKHFVTYNGVMCNIFCESYRYFGYLSLKNSNLQQQSKGSSQPFISYDILYEIPIILPTNQQITQFDTYATTMFQSLEILIHSKKIYEDLLKTLLSKLAKN